jgi:hypothetical protein
MAFQVSLWGVRNIHGPINQLKTPGEPRQKDIRFYLSQFDFTATIHLAMFPRNGTSTALSYSPLLDFLATLYIMK